MRFFLLFAYITAFVWLFSAEAQQNINSLTTKDIKVNGNLEVNSTSLASKPCPVMTEAQRNAIASPQSGRCIYNSNTNQLNIFSGTIWKSAGGGISNWETAFNYALNDVVIESNKIYQANTAHTSTVFASDIANWTQIANNVSDASGVLPMTNGGTDKNLTPTLGGVVYTDANSMEVLGAGTSGQVLKSNGAAAPTWQDASNKLQGQDQTEVNFTKLKVPKRSATPTATGEYLLEADDNLLYNGGFEATPDLDGWTCVGAGSSFTIESKPTYSSVVISGDKTLAIGCATVGGCTCTQDFPVNLQQAGRSVLLNGIVRSSSDTQGLKLTYRENGADTSITTQNVLNGIPATEAVIGSSATTIGIKLTVPYSATPLTVRVDDIKMAYGTAVTNQPAIGPETPYTPVFTNVNTPTNINFTYQQIGSNVLIKGYYTGAGGTATNELRIGLPSGMTTSSKINPIQSLGTLNSSYSGGFDSAVFVIATSNKSYLNVGIFYTGGSGLSVANTASVGFVSGRNYSFSVLVPINELASSIPTYTGRCNDPRNCETEFSAYILGTGVVTNESLDFINGNCTVASTSNYTCNFNTSLFGNAPNCSVTYGGAGSSSAIRTAAEKSTTASSIQWILDTSGGLSAANTVIKCQRQGQDYINAKTLQQNVALKSYVQTPSTTGKVGFCSAKISATGVISDQLGGCFASCTNATTPVCTFTSNYWKSGSVPNCGHSLNVNAQVGSKTTTTTTFQGLAIDFVNTATSGDREYFCHGEIQ